MSSTALGEVGEAAHVLFTAGVLSQADEDDDEDEDPQWRRNRRQIPSPGGDRVSRVWVGQ